MFNEIERKFLVKSDAYKKAAYQSTTIVQGYLSNTEQSTVRVRINDKKAYLTIKGKSEDGGLSRLEWEKEIDMEEAYLLLKLCEDKVIKKQRYKVQVSGHIFEVDEFEDKYQGLVIAEIELKTTDESFEKPDWLGEEVTGDKRYYNAVMAGC